MLDPLPPQPVGVEFPTHSWQTTEAGGSIVEPLAELIAEHAASKVEEKDPFGQSLALVVVQGGRIVAEQYGPTADVDTTLISWSMAKSMLHAAVGIAVADGTVDIDAPAAMSQWSDADDPRAAITMRDLLMMRSGLSWNEDYVDDSVSNVIEMLFGSGADDCAAYAASLALDFPVGEHWCYSSGTSNIVSRVLTDALGGADAMQALLDDKLFGPLGMTSARPTFDASGTWVASSYVHATARDFARFGLLYMRNGRWGDTAVLPEGWVDGARRPHAFDPSNGQGYAMHWWTVFDGHGSFACNGYEGQRIQVVPALDLVIVRLGKSPAETYANLRDFYTRLVGCFASV